MKVSTVKYKTREAMPEPVTRISQPLVSSSREEYCLALLLQYPELKGRSEELLPEYFENSENREIFTAWQQVDDLSSLKDSLDPAIHEHIDNIMKRSLPSNNMERRYADGVLELRKQHLKNQAARRAEILALEAESGGTGADLAKLEEEGLKIGMQLKEIYTQKKRGSQN